jgi:diguanylate cyclase (GGDEF)-like protein
MARRKPKQTNRSKPSQTPFGRKIAEAVRTNRATPRAEPIQKLQKRYLKYVQDYYTKRGMSRQDARAEAERRLGDRVRERELGKTTLLERLTDDMTGVHSKAAFEDYLRLFAADSRRNPERKYSVMHLDLNDFKPINDEHGHQAGDASIKAFANVLKNSVRRNDVVGRLGGDEFAILIDGDAEDAKRVADRIHKRMKKPGIDHPKLRKAPLSVSIGVAEVRPRSNTLERAEMAMYRAKKDRREGEVPTAFWRRGMKMPKKK